jgi:acetyl esterase
MPLDPQAHAVLQQLTPPGARPLQSLSVAEARQTMEVFAAFGGAPEPVHQVKDRTFPGPAGDIPVRIYTPGGRRPFPLLVYFHGGGWVLGDIPTYDPLCRALANAAGCVVVSVDYRLAPEHPFPAAVEDCHAAVRWAVATAGTLQADPARVAVGGDSAGGNLAAVIALRTRDQGGPPLAAQLLIYPVTDYLPDLPSYRENDRYLLTREGMAWLWGHYLRREADRKNPDAVPLQGADLSGLPPALVVTAEFDPLRDEGEKYAARLQEAGVPVVLKRYAGMIHGFLSLAGVLDRGREAIAEIGEWLRKGLSRK